MTSVSASKARSNLYRLIDDVAESHQPVVILGKRKNAVLVSLQDWNTIQEKLYLASKPDVQK
ncbi:MAG: type II toxin-antitoxin system Phd/YefM family antitoxin [Moraxellaceae bacterium]|nr:type II toxin-antitoxin system Phd/YefM family antitoxin [Moraxellaceae bacterium]MDZ4387281.1 type II toxin-antitoxin system Phd/YefM family antitoxin [Moraxellaceae bacterium]